MIEFTKQELDTAKSVEIERVDFIKSVMSVFTISIIYMIFSQIVFSITGISDNLFQLLTDYTTITFISMILLIVVNAGLSVSLFELQDIKKQFIVAIISLTIISLVFSPFIDKLVGESYLSAVVAFVGTGIIFAILRYKASTFKGDFNLFGMIAFYGSVLMLFVLIMFAIFGIVPSIGTSAILIFLIGCTLFYDFGQLLNGNATYQQVIPMGVRLTESSFLMFIQLLQFMGLTDD